MAPGRQDTAVQFTASGEFAIELIQLRADLGRIPFENHLGLAPYEQPVLGHEWRAGIILLAWL